MSSSAANRRRMTACFSLRQTGGHAGPPLHRQKKLTALHFRYPRKLRSVPSFFLSKSNPLRWVSIWILYRKPHGILRRFTPQDDTKLPFILSEAKDPVNRTHSSTGRDPLLTPCRNCRLRACFATARKAARLRKLRAAFLCPRQRRPAILRMTG